MDISVYSYDIDLRPGVNLPAKLINRIQVSDAVIALLTAQGAASPAVNQEIGAARQAGKLVIPIIEKGVDPARLTFLQGLEYEVLDRTNVSATIIRLTSRLGALKASNDRAKWIVATVVGGLFLWANRGGEVDDE